MKDGVGGAAYEPAVEVIAAAGRESDESSAALLRCIHDLSGWVTDSDDRFDFYPFVLQALGGARHKHVGFVDRGRGPGGVCLRLPSIVIRHRWDGVADGDRRPEGLRKLLDDGQDVSGVIGAIDGDENPVKLGKSSSRGRGQGRR